MTAIKQKGTGRLTLGGNNALIKLDFQKPLLVESYFRGNFNLEPFRKATVKADKAPEELTEPKSGNDIYTPKPDELVRIPFRMLTATIVAGGTWRATDFSNKAVLKKAAQLLAGKTAFTDHFQYVGNQIGSIETTKFSEQMKNGNTTIPAGIDGVFLIDGKMNEQLVRSLLMPTPAIQSCSVTVEFEWESSHDFESEDDFMRNVGDMIDGKMVTRVVTNIIDFHECSICWMGADPWAKILDKDGKPVNPEMGADYTNITAYTKSLYEEGKKYFASYNLSGEGINLNRTKEAHKHQNTAMLKKLQDAIRISLGKDESYEVTEQDVENFQLVKKEEFIVLSAAKTKVEELNTELKELKDKQPNLVAKSEFEAEKEKAKLATETLEAAKEDIQLGKTYKANKLAEAIRLCRLKNTGKTEDELTKLDEGIKALTTEQLDARLAELAGGVGEKFAFECKSCHGKEYSLRSTLEDESKGKTETDATHRDKFMDKYKD